MMMSPNESEMKTPQKQTSMIEKPCFVIFIQLEMKIKLTITIQLIFENVL